MNLQDKKYSKYELIREMMGSPGIIRNFDHNVTDRFTKPVKSKKGLFLTGEGRLKGV
jgi:hypothetical protein